MIIVSSAFEMVLIGKPQHPGAGAPVYKFLPSAKGLGAVGPSWTLAMILGGVFALSVRASDEDADNKATERPAAARPGSVPGRDDFNSPSPLPSLNRHTLFPGFSSPPSSPPLPAQKTEIPRYMCQILEEQRCERVGSCGGTPTPQNLAFPAARIPYLAGSIETWKPLAWPA